MKCKPSLSGNGTLQGHDYVDLGLPSGTLWATCNVGANSPEEYGDCFAWGETTPKTTYGWSTYKYGTDYNQLTKYCNNSDYGKNGFTDTKTTLDAGDDAATANWGSGWRMPTKAEMIELKEECSWEWTAPKGVYGYRVTGPNGNSLFLPAAGNCDECGLGDAGSLGGYWSGLLTAGSPSDAFGLYFYSNSVNWGYGDRFYGRSVRPVVKR
ncbi:MAG: hypothetical protein J6Y77_04360 [Paludibacteraceae bacterium]|nr:hypothetical protein [Paludibacteraceae bacterium]